jgi:Mg-chelatase subunit ChlD
MPCRSRPERLAIFLSILLACLAAFACTSEEEGEARANDAQEQAAGSRAGTGGSSSENDSTGAAGSGQPSGAAGGPAADDPGMCVDQQVRFSRVNPWMTLVIDASGSMSEAFPGAASRWAALRTALLDSDQGLIARLQGIVYFGMVLYSGNGESTVVSPPGGQASPADEQCPRLVEVEPQINNLEALEQSFPEKPLGGWSPTAAALEQASALMPDSDRVREQDLGPRYLVLCTDGEPTGCLEAGATANAAPPLDLEGTDRAVSDGALEGVGTYVVNLAGEGPELQQYLDLLAEAGGTGSPAFSPLTAEELGRKLFEIARGALGCTVRLNGSVQQGQECRGELVLNGKKRECNGPQGWKLRDARHIELQADACQEFNDNPSSILQAVFPCGVFTAD